MWVLGRLGALVGALVAGNGCGGSCWGDISRSSGAHTTQKASARKRVEASLVPVRDGQPKWMGMGPTSIELLVEIELKSLILAQIERWRHALHMQVERQRGGNPGGERRTGE